MNKCLKALWLCIMMAFFTSCDPPTIEDYQKLYVEACEKGDFVEARKILDKMKPLFDLSDDDELSNFEEHQAYVDNAEISSLVSDGSTEAINRIIFLMKKDGYSGMTKDDVFDLALNLSNERLCEKMIAMNAIFTTEDATTAAQNDMSELLDRMLASDPTIIADKVVFNYFKLNKGEEKLIELIKYGANKDDSEAVIETAIENGYEELALQLVQKQLERAINELRKTEFSKRPALGYLKVKNEEDLLECDLYETSIRYYNENCQEVMVKAMAYGLDQIANKSFEMMKPNIKWKEVGDWAQVVGHSKNKSSYVAYLVYENRDEINEARNTLKNYK